MAGETRLLFRNIDEEGLDTIKVYQRLGGYEALQNAFKEMEPETLLSELEDSGLRGRGGAGFSMGKKASFLPRGDMDKYLCCNADESEPGAFKDRELMQKNPHQLIEGIIIAARAAGANRCFIFIRGEYDLQGDILDAAVEEAYDAGFLGDDVLGTGEQVELVVHRGAGAYICGEETALLDSLEGKRGNPRLKPPFPAVQGLYGGPTLINNVETLSNVPHIVASGADWFKGFGTEQSPGTKVVSVSGDVQRPGNYEVELGIPTGDLINELAGGVRDGRSIKGFFPGGSSSPVLTADEGLKLPYSFEAMQEAGLDARFGFDHRLRRHHERRRAGPADGEVLPPRVVREVHSLPRGDELDREDAGADDPRRGDANRPRDDGRGPEEHHRPLPLRARRLDGGPGRLDGREVPRGVRRGDRARRPLVLGQRPRGRRR